MDWRTGLPYGWWKKPAVLADIACLVGLLAVMLFLAYIAFLG